MKKLIVLLCVMSLQSFAVELKEAVQHNIIEVTPKSLGGIGEPSLRLTLKNKTSAVKRIEIVAGTVFICDDKGAQNLIVIQDSSVKLNPLQIIIVDLWGMCIEPNDYCPKLGDGFTIAEKIDDNLQELAHYIAKNKYFNHTSQSAIWALINGSNLESIYGIDTSMSNGLVRNVAQLLDIPVPEATIQQPPKPINIVSVRTNLGFRISKGSYYDFVLTDSEGNVLEEMFRQRPLYNGLYIYTAGVNRVDDEGSQYVLKVLDQRGNVVASKPVNEETVEDSTLARAKARTTIEYTLTKPVKNASLYVENEKGEIIQYFYMNRNLPIERRKQTLKFDYLQGIEQNFTVKLVDSSGKVYAQSKVSLP